MTVSLQVTIRQPVHQIRDFEHGAVVRHRGDAIGEIRQRFNQLQHRPAQAPDHAVELVGSDAAGTDRSALAADPAPLGVALRAKVNDQALVPGDGSLRARRTTASGRKLPYTVLYS